jgi:para-aminobenzoate synthetase component I
MPRLNITPLPYTHPRRAFRHLANEQGSLFLEDDRYAYIAAFPMTIDTIESCVSHPAIPPFQTGWAGLMGYDQPHVPRPSSSLIHMPAQYIHYYPCIVSFDKVAKKAYHVVDTLVAPPTLNLPLWGDDTRTLRLGASMRLHPLLSPLEYQSKVDVAKEYLYAGDCYQLNIGQPFVADVPKTFSSYDLFCILQEQAFAANAGYLCLGDGQYVVSHSPELLFSLDTQRHLTSKPIKGTRPRHRVPSIDRALAKTLCTSEKDIAENLMIVDLVRHDMAGVCDAGSIAVTHFASLEKLEYVQHLVSTITGRLSLGKTGHDALYALFPGGSVTGAPKKRAMDIIADIEGWQRGAWCGSLGFMSVTGAARFNIAIRTTQIDKGHLVAWSGCGITHLSHKEEEYHESLAKIDVLKRVLEG